MLDAVTKRRIDTARNILVGRVPDPKSQVEQITIALIYKFMDDMDAQSEELGGQRKFFAGDFAHYGWAHLLRAGLGGQEMLNRYAEAIYRMPENPGLPPLFRNIFSNAYLPYRDPETLREFLKVIDEFTYDDSESLGDAFESLLAALDAQGDAGQFRTPRHIIDFIVAVIDPQKNETILDPACGTAGFLISAYKHILAANTDANGAVTLTPDERRRLAGNLHGYDLSPDLVRLSLVNMYLHGFPAPQIYEYDTLTSEERWHDFADVIMANPPFMSPKGGIRPHNRFSVSSRRSEVLFVDYIAEHLTPGGRAGVIVPEGVIFQSQRGHTQLRRLLVADYLVAVVSLPAGVFQPYSGVKTSILILDRTLAPRAHGIAFFKIASDGYDLGAQRRPIDDNDLPIVQAELSEYLQRLRAGVALDDFAPTLGLVVSKERIAADGEYGLRGEKYQEYKTTATQWPMAELADFCEVSKGTAITRKELSFGDIPVIAGGRVPSAYHNAANRTGETITVSGSGAYAGFVSYHDGPIFASDCTTIKPKPDFAVTKFVFYSLAQKQDDVYALQSGAAQPHVYPKQLARLRIPLPPLAVQRELVAEIEGYQRVIDGCQAVVDNWLPRIEVDPGWEMMQIKDFCDVSKGTAITRKEMSLGDIPVIAGGRVPSAYHNTSNRTGETITVSGSGAYAGFVSYHDGPIFASDCTTIKPESDFAEAKFVFYSLMQRQDDVYALQSGAAQPHVYPKQLALLYVALPPLSVQQAIVSELEAEAAAVEQARGLAERMAARIAAAVGRVWGSQ